MKKIIALVLLVMAFAVFATDCIEINETTTLDADNDSCFVITEDDVEFDCDGNTICDGADDTCISIEAEGVTIKNCVIEGDDGETGIHVKEDDAEITGGCEITGSKIGVFLDGVKDCVLEETLFEDCDKGVSLDDASDCELDDLEFNSCETPIYFKDSNDNELSNIEVEMDDYLSYYIRFLVEDEDGDPIKDAEVTLIAMLGEDEDDDPFDDEETDADGYTPWILVHAIWDYGGDNETDLDHELLIEYDDEEYEDDDVDIDKTETITIEFEDVNLEEEEEELAALGEACSANSDCASGYCCLQGEYAGTCRSGPAFCPSYECIDDDDCEDDEKCEDNECVEITGECGYADDHKWIEYECCDDDDCEDDEKCEDNECIEIECECGDIEDHKCTAECCDNDDCPEGFKCIDMVCLQGNFCEYDEECANNERCVDNYCEEITGSCGYAFGHRWIPYECCVDTDCPEGKQCINNECVIAAKIEEDGSGAGEGGGLGGICTSALIILSIGFLSFCIKRE